MAEYSIIMKQKNDQGQYDTLYPQTLGSQIQGNIQSSQIEGDIPSSQISGNIPSSQITGQFPASQINGIYTADETLTDAVASMFGFGASAVPNDMFNVLTHAGDLHVWKRTRDIGEEIPATYQLGERQSSVIFSATSSTNVSIYYGDSLSVTPEGVVSIANEQLASVNSGSDISAFSFLKGKYIRVPDYQQYLRGIALVNDDAVFTKNPTYTLNSSSIQKVVGIPAIPPDTYVDYPVSPNRNAYQEGTVDGTTVEYMGQVGDKARIETGSYVGTGTYGESNPNTLEFDSPPKALVIFYGIHQNGLSVSSSFGFWFNSASSLQVYNGSFYGNPVSVIENSISWYATNASAQLNNSGYTFGYAAFL